MQYSNKLFITKKNMKKKEKRFFPSFVKYFLMIFEGKRNSRNFKSKMKII